MLTIFRALTPIPFNILVLTGNFIPAVVLLIISFITDFIDGKIARKLNVESRFGALLDAICDKIMFLGITIPVIAINPISIINLVLEGFIATTNVVALKNKLEPKSRIIGKIKMFPLAFTIIISYLSMFIGINPALIYSLVGITALIQSIAFVDYAIVNKKTKLNKKTDYIQIKPDVEKELKEIKQKDEIIKSNTKEYTIEELQSFRNELTNNEIETKFVKTLKKDDK